MSVGVLDGLLGRPAPPSGAPGAGRLLALPAAAAVLEARTGFVPTGTGGVCHRLVEGGPFGAFGRAQREIERLLSGDPARRTGVSTDPHGWGWTHLTRAPDDFEALVADLHLIETVFADAGYGRYLLCSVTGFRRGTERQLLYLVHTPVRDAFYPWAPRLPEAPSDPEEADGQEGAAGAPARGRSNLVETRTREALAETLPIEPDRHRWFPVWDAPGL